MAWVPKLTGDCAVTIACDQRPVYLDDDNNDAHDEKDDNDDFVVMVVIETSKLLAIVGLKAFKHMFTSSTGGDDKVNGNEFPINK